MCVFQFLLFSFACAILVTRCTQADSMFNLFACTIDFFFFFCAILDHSKSGPQSSFYPRVFLLHNVRPKALWVELFMCLSSEVTQDQEGTGGLTEGLFICDRKTVSIFLTPAFYAWIPKGRPDLHRQCLRIKYGFACTMRRKQHCALWIRVGCF